MSEELLHRVDVRPEVEHQNREGVPSAVERDVFRYPCPDCPSLQLHEVIAGVAEVREDVRLGVSSLAHEDDRLWIDVDVLLSACFLLLEDYARELSLLANLFPFHFLDAALAQPGEAAEKESPAQDGVLAFCRCHRFDHLQREVHSLSFLDLEALDAAQGIMGDDAVLEGLIDASAELVEV